MVERQLPKLHTRVRFPSPALAGLPERVQPKGRKRRVAVWRLSDAGELERPGALQFLNQ
jgi:hypothetical protein